MHLSEREITKGYDPTPPLKSAFFADFGGGTQSSAQEGALPILGEAGGGLLQPRCQHRHYAVY